MWRLYLYHLCLSNLTNCCKIVINIKNTQALIWILKTIWQSWLCMPYRWKIITMTSRQCVMASCSKKTTPRKIDGSNRTNRIKSAISVRSENNFRRNRREVPMVTECHRRYFPLYLYTPINILYRQQMHHWNHPLLYHKVHWHLWPDNGHISRCRHVITVYTIIVILILTE